MPFYEAMYLVHPSVDDERLAEVIARYNQVVENAGGVIEHSGKWDRRRLAYPINKVQEATYVLMYFRADPQVPAELDRLFRISDEVIRHLIIRHDKPHLVLTAVIPEETAEAEPEQEQVAASSTEAAESQETAVPEEVNAEAPASEEAAAGEQETT
ncbi:MAG: 30S ribosomal protein S6 [Armatimonadota bacterium]|nr:30S ribosomal protein S6 [Armatimonadota bacterium]MDW8105313.1 30S ribosomal protein S6 [Armatimonadota bacterium]MDW8289255.1 30S ribosomal protein S6 [Armatimonadota bacterium]